jgi:hypothetical protein
VPGLRPLEVVAQALDGAGSPVHLQRAAFHAILHAGNAAEQGVRDIEVEITLPGAPPSSPQTGH